MSPFGPIAIVFVSSGLQETPEEAQREFNSIPQQQLGAAEGDSGMKSQSEPESWYRIRPMPCASLRFEGVNVFTLSATAEYTAKSLSPS
uniref:Uncharacterized protein n=1 Tax=Mycena chlorophos TaxID=658473 RepID=A0ABQ0L9J2_MYCCL|nr:predicted protein [Mycena chlorophos]